MERKISLAIEKKRIQLKRIVWSSFLGSKLVGKQDCCSFHILHLNTSSAKETEPVNLSLNRKKKNQSYLDIKFSIKFDKTILIIKIQTNLKNISSSPNLNKTCLFNVHDSGWQNLWLMQWWKTNDSIMT